MRGRGRQKVVRLVARGLAAGETACNDEVGQNLELLDEFGVERAAGLIARKRLVPVGRLIERVPAHEHCARTFGFIKPKENIGEAEDRPRALVPGPANGFGQRVIGAVHKGVAIDHQKRASQRWVSFSRTTSLARFHADPNTQDGAFRQPFAPCKVGAETYGEVGREKAHWIPRVVRALWRRGRHRSQ